MTPARRLEGPAGAFQARAAPSLQVAGDEDLVRLVIADPYAARDGAGARAVQEPLGQGQVAI